MMSPLATLVLTIACCFSVMVLLSPLINRWYPNHNNVHIMFLLNPSHFIRKLCYLIWLMVPFFTAFDTFQQVNFYEIHLFRRILTPNEWMLLFLKTFLYSDTMRVWSTISFIWVVISIL